MSRTAAELTALMDEAVEFSIRHVDSGGLPFVGVLIDRNGYVSRPGVNKVGRTGDPTAHAEIVAMRAAMTDLRRGDLKGASLLATGEPCGLCYRFALDRGVEEIYVAVDSDAVAEYGFDYRDSYRAFQIDRTQIADIIHPLPVARGLQPFERFMKLRHSSVRAPSLPRMDTKGRL